VRRPKGSDFGKRGLDAFVASSRLMGIPVDDDTIAGVAGWFQFYGSWQGRRVVGFRTPEDIATKLIADSFAASHLGFAPQPETEVLDLGSGNGWPGLAARFLWPCRVSLLDGRLGACQFLSAYVAAAHLAGIRVLPIRAEEAGGLVEHKGAFGLVFTRAMAAPGVSLELSVPFIQKGGHAVLWLGPEHQEMLLGAESVQELGLSREDIVRYSLPHGLGSRMLGVFRRQGDPMKGYPRPLASVKRNPLL